MPGAVQPRDGTIE